MARVDSRTLSSRLVVQVASRNRLSTAVSFLPVVRERQMAANITTEILATLLNDGTSPTTSKQILKPETVNEMFKNQIPQFPDFARAGIPAAKPEYTNPAPELYPQEGNPAQGWGITFMITQEAGATGRGKNTAWWAGIINSFWWCDREKGVAGFIAGQMLPFGDPAIMGAWGACEAAVYAGLS